MIFATVVLLGAYWAAPLLVNKLAPRFADRLGVETIDVNIGRPGLRNIEIKRIYVAGSDYSMLGEDGQVNYVLSDLLKGHVQTIVFGSLSLAINSATRADSGQPASMDQILPAVPFTSLRVDRLTLAFPDTGFVGKGQAELGMGILAFSLRGIEPEPASHFSITANLSSDGVFEARFGEVGDGDAEFLSMRGAITNDTLQVAGQFDVTGYALELAAAVASLPAGTGTVRGQFDSQFAWPLAESLAWQEVGASFPQLSIDWRAADGELTLTGLTGSANLAEGKITAAVAGAVRTKVDDYDLNISLPKDYRLSYETSTLRGVGNLDLRARNSEQDLTAVIRSFSLDTRDGAKLRVDSKAKIRTEDLQLDGTLKGNVAVASLEPTAADGQLEFAGTVKLPDQLHPMAMTTRFGINGTALTAKGKLTSGVVKDAPFESRYDLESGAGNFNATNQINFRQPLAAATVPGWDETYDLDRGNIDASVKLSWRSLDKVQTELALKVANATGRYDVYQASGIGGELTFSASDISDGETWRLHPSPVRLQHIDVGVPVRDLSLQLAWSGDNAEVADASASLLGGQAAATDFVYDLAQGNATLTLALQNLDLAAVLALEGDDIIASGRLNGTLPVTIADNKVSVSGGSVAAAPPGGTIQLKPSISGPSGQPGLDFALLALKDFKYSELDANIDYAENGDLQLAVHLKGRNPAVERGRPIHYNLNISENVPVLLQSLRLKDQLTERIEAEVKK